MIDEEYFGLLSGPGLVRLIETCRVVSERGPALHPDFAYFLDLRERMALHSLLDTSSGRNDVLVKAQRECEVRRVRTQQ